MIVAPSAVLPGPATATGLSTAAVRVVVVDDQSLFADALAARLAVEPDVEVLATVTTAREARDACKCLHPTVVTVDVQLGDDDGIALGRTLHAELPDLAVVYVTCEQDPTRVVEAVRTGARAWVPKETPSTQLLAVLRGAVIGESWLPPRLLTAVLGQLTAAGHDRTGSGAGLNELTEREHQVLDLLAEGLDRGEIAARLYVSANTVRTHTRNLFGKLDAHSSLEAVARGRDRGLVPARAEYRPSAAP